MSCNLGYLKQKPYPIGEYPTFYDRAKNEYHKLVNMYADEYGSLRKGKTHAEAWCDELFPNGIADLSWGEIYWDLKTHREHPPECDCNGHNNPLGCAECRVSARVNSY